MSLTRIDATSDSAPGIEASNRGPPAGRFVLIGAQGLTRLSDRWSNWDQPDSYGSGI